jgi:hypothetical protein
MAFKIGDTVRTIEGLEGTVTAVVTPDHDNDDDDAEVEYEVTWADGQRGDYFPESFFAEDDVDYGEKA